VVPAPDTAPERAETGTQNQEGIAGVTAAIDFLASLSSAGSRRERLARAYDALHDQGLRLMRMLSDGLGAIRGVRLHAPPRSHRRTPTVSLTIEGLTSGHVARALADRAVFVSHGDFYAATLVERLGVEGLVRIGCACYTTEEEVRRVVDGVAAIAERRVAVTSG
jgi:selenocysteine lyase/cysteine desulfurase